MQLHPISSRHMASLFGLKLHNHLMYTDLGNGTVCLSIVDFEVIIMAMTLVNGEVW